MAKEINIFSVSFLDLLSGALGAVIILYIIIPKISAQDEEVLKTIKEMQVNVEEIDSMMMMLENSVDKELFAELQEKIQNMNKQMIILTGEVKNLQGKVKELRAQLGQCREKLAKLQSMEKEVKVLRARIKKLEEEIRQKNEELKSKQEEIKSLQSENEELRRYKEWMERCGFTPDDDCPPPVNADIGFKFKGKRIVFILDASGSMLEVSNGKEDRLYPVKAAVKMILAVMGSDFSADIVQFPYFEGSNCSAYRANWRGVQMLTAGSKEDAYRFIYAISSKQGNGTPSEEAILYVLHNYPDITDIVFISDGTPTVACDDTNPVPIDPILEKVKRANTGRVRINTIGVGSDFFSNPQSDQVRFMTELAKENDNGFFIGL